MSRRIDTGTPAAGAEETRLLGSGPLYLGPVRRKGGDDYLGRLAKYIPAEIVGLYLATAGMVPVTAPERRAVLWTIFALCFVFVPVYFFFATTERNKKKPLWTQIVLATIAYPVWVFAIGGPFADYAWYGGYRYIGSVVLAFVTVGMGFIQPPPNS